MYGVEMRENKEEVFYSYAGLHQFCETLSGQQTYHNFKMYIPQYYLGF